MSRRRPYNPLAALNPAQQMALARKYVAAQTTPLLKQINSGFDARARAGQGAIAGYTNELAQSLVGAKAQTHDIYAQAQGEQSAIDTALANRIAAAGAGGGAELGQKLATAGLSPDANTLAQQGAGAAAASAGSSSASLSSLVARGAASENYAGQLPGLAKLGGLQRAKDYAAQLESERATQVGDLRSKIPALIQSILGDVRNQEFQKAAANLSYGGDLAKIQADTAYHNEALAQRDRAVAAANARTGMTLRERAREHDRSLAEQTSADAAAARARTQANRERARHNRASEKTARYRAHHPASGKGKKKSGNPWDK